MSGKTARAGDTAEGWEAWPQMRPVPILAESALPSGGEAMQIGIWLGCAMVVIAGIDKALSIADRVRGPRKESFGIDGQPVGVSLHSPYATVAQVAELRRDHELLAARVEAHYHELFLEGQRREERLGEKIEKLDGDNEGRVRTLHERINPLAESVASIAGILRGAKVERSAR